MDNQLITCQVLIIEDAEGKVKVPLNLAITKLGDTLEENDVIVKYASSYAEAFSLIEKDSDFDCLLVSTDLDFARSSQCSLLNLLGHIRENQPQVPLLLLGDCSECEEVINNKITEFNCELINIEQADTALSALLVCSRIKNYREKLLTVFFNAVIDYGQPQEIYRHTNYHYRKNYSRNIFDFNCKKSNVYAPYPVIDYRQEVEAYGI